MVGETFEVAGKEALSTVLTFSSGVLLGGYVSLVENMMSVIGAGTIQTLKGILSHF